MRFGDAQMAAGMILFSALLFLSSCAPAAPSSRSSGVQPWLVGEKLQYGPQAISGERCVALEVVVHEDRSKEIYIRMSNLRTRQSERVYALPQGTWPWVLPAIDGDRIVWAAALNGSTDTLKSNYDVFMLDLATGAVSQITTDLHAQIEPRISGDTVVWLDSRNMETEEFPPRYDVYSYDLKTGVEQRLTTTTSIIEDSLSISGGIVAWSDARYAVQRPGKRQGITDQNNEVFVYDLAKNVERRITENAGNDMQPCVDGRRVVWLRQPDPLRVNCDIFLYDLQLGQETRISSSGYAVPQAWPAISGNRIVWSDSRLALGNSAGDVAGIAVGENADNGVSYFGASEIYSYDLATTTESLLIPAIEHRSTTGAGDNRLVYVGFDIWMRPVLSGDHLVYELETGIQPYLYAVDLSERQ